MNRLAPRGTGQATFPLQMGGTSLLVATLAALALSMAAAPVQAQAVAPAKTPTGVTPITSPVASAALPPGHIAKPTLPAKPVPVTVQAKTATKPLWNELTPVQQQSLRPLAGNWASLGEAQKRKWLEVSRSFQTLPAPEQAKMHSRMAEWGSLSAKQRADARLNFAETKSLSPAEKTANWNAYQALSAEEKQKLAAKATPKPNGAAVAVKPVDPSKLAPVPVTRKTAKTTADVTATTAQVNQNTLLPLPGMVTEPTAVQKN